MGDIHAALEIGTSRTVLAIGEASQNGRLRVACHAEIQSTGVRKSQVLDIPQATQSIRAVLHEIERKQDRSGSKVTIGNAFLAVSGPHVRADHFTGTAQVAGGRVGDDAIDTALRASRALALPPERELLDVVDQDYAVDELTGVASPRGMSGKVLRLNTMHVHADRNRIENARTAADAARLEIREPLFAATCAAEAVLGEHEKRNGALVLDLGGGSTGYAVYTDGYAAAAGVLGVGGDHVTNDIAHAFQTTYAQAEGLKTRESSALVVPEGENDRIRVDPGESALMDSRTVSRKALDTVVNARVKELFCVVREILEDHDLMHRLHAGVVLTGGGARLRGIEAVAAQTLGARVRIGVPSNVDGLEDEPFPAAYATIAGALLYAHRNYEDKSILGGLLRRFF